jgi:methylglutaconyl-CoA hydratase
MSRDSYSRIKTKEEGKVLQIILARPEKHNAFDEVTISEITHAFHQAPSNDQAKVVLLKGEGKSFCAGADLEWMKRAKNFTQEQNREDALKLAEMIHAIFTLPKPVVCSVHGAVFGGGVGLVAACDVVVASREATFSLSEVRLGIAPATISPILYRKMGESVCRRIMLTGERFSAQEALSFGLVHKVVDDDSLEGTISEILSMILRNGPQALASCKELMFKVPFMSLQDAKEYTARMIAQLRSSEEGQEGITSFLEKRKPRWID